ncbi:MAG: uracil phosphoribosyltransferase [Candidatus Pacearchaeota archaeon]
MLKRTSKRGKPIPEYYFKKWLNEIIKRTKTLLERKKNKVIVNIAGASAAGKSTKINFLIQKLKETGFHALVLSTDDFYKGVSRMIAEKLSNRFADSKIDWRKLEEVIRKITGNKRFSEKFSERDLELILKYLKSYSVSGAEEIISAIKNEFENINFDTPEAVDLESLAKILSELKKNKKVGLPVYSMEVSEPVGKRNVDGSNYNVILVEGIYALNDKIVQYADIKTFIDADKRTLLMRRFRRDVLLGKRASFLPEIALWMTLEIVLPGYDKYILPDRKKSDFVLKDDYTGAETFDTKTYDVQDKIVLTKADAERLEKLLKQPFKVKIQRDFYFTNDDEIFNPQHLIRVREENGKLKDLVHKGMKMERDDGKIIRPTEIYVKKFGIKYKNTEELINAFRKAGFKLAAEIYKIRRLYRKGNIEIALDEVKGLGNFVELRTNNKLSKSPEIDKFKKEFGLDKKSSAGPYADEYFTRIQAKDAWKQEIILNQGSDREAILKSKACEIIKQTKKIFFAFRNLRRGYPKKPLSQQCKGKEFRKNAEIIIEAIAEKTLKGIKPEKVVLVMPWRAGLAFAKSYMQKGVKNFYHLSARRDEKTLKTLIDFEFGKINPKDIVIIADPMLASGNTIINTIERVISKGASPKKIIINSVVAAPVGIQKIKKLYPEVRIIIGSLDEKLDYRGYIVPGLGDFGDKYFADFSAEELKELLGIFKIGKLGYKKMVDRIKKQKISEIMKALIERDFKDIEIDEKNRKELIKKGLIIQKPKKEIIVDTGKTEGVKDVIELIKSNISRDVKVIAIEGMSGTGKTTTAKELKKAIKGKLFSMGEIFRYLTYCYKEKKEFNLKRVLERLSYKIIEGNLKLFDGKLNVSDELSKELRTEVIEKAVPEISKFMQEYVIKFVQKQISNLKKKFPGIIIIEGRSFTLDFLPSDLRVKLVADPMIRAERKLAEEFLKS